MKGNCSPVVAMIVMVMGLAQAPWASWGYPAHARQGHALARTQKRVRVEGGGRKGTGVGLGWAWGRVLSPPVELYRGR